MMVKYYGRDDTIMLLQQINNDYIIMAYKSYRESYGIWNYGTKQFQKVCGTVGFHQQ